MVSPAAKKVEIANNFRSSLDGMDEATTASAILADRFIAMLERLLPGFIDNDEILGLAVSGGPDSLALLLLAHRIIPGKIAAATVDHGLRNQSAAEARFVADICAERKIPHDILRPIVPIRGNIQSVARQVRYGLLHDWMKHRSIHWLATAHHADDQLETMIMRVLRGSGIDGMSGIRAKRGDIIRPLLGVQKRDLEQYVADHDITAIDDPSNRDHSFDRVRVREALNDLQGFDTSLASQCAMALDEARDAIEWMVGQLAEQYLQTTEGECALIKTDFPSEIKRRLLLRSLHYIDPALSPRGGQIDQTIIALERGETLTLGNILCRGGESWTFKAAPKRQAR